MILSGIRMKSGDPRVAPSPTANIVVKPYVGFTTDSFRGRWNLTLSELGRDATSATLERIVATRAEIRIMSSNPKFTVARYEYSLTTKIRAINAATLPTTTAKYLKNRIPSRND